VRSSSKRTDSVDSVICVRKIGKCMEGELFKDLERGLLEYEITGKFLANIKRDLKGEMKKQSK